MEVLRDKMAYRLKVVFKDRTTDMIPITFKTQKDARAYAYKHMRSYVAFFELKVKSGKEVQRISMDNGMVCISYLDNYGNYHYDKVNKDGTIRKG